MTGQRPTGGVGSNQYGRRGRPIGRPDPQRVGRFARAPHRDYEHGDAVIIDGHPDSPGIVVRKLGRVGIGSNAFLEVATRSGTVCYATSDVRRLTEKPPTPKPARPAEAAAFLTWVAEMHDRHPNRDTALCEGLARAAGTVAGLGPNLSETARSLRAYARTYREPAYATAADLIETGDHTRLVPPSEWATNPLNAPCTHCGEAKDRIWFDRDGTVCVDCQGR